MTASTARYLGYNLVTAYLQYNVASTVTEIQWFFANKFEMKSNTEDLVFEGDGNKMHVYLTSGLTVTLNGDAQNAAAISTVFGKSVVSTSVPNGGSNLLWYGDAVEAAGVAAGLRMVGSAIKDVGGVQTVVNLCVWVPLGTATLAALGGADTLKKWSAGALTLSAVRGTKDVGGNALPSVPAGGAMYAVYEV